MFPLQPKVCLFIENQKKTSKAITQKKTILNQLAKENSLKHQRKQTIYLCKKQKKEKNFPLLKKYFFKSRELKGGLENRHGISNHGLAGIVFKLNTCLLSYNHLLQPKEVEGA